MQETRKEKVIRYLLLLLFVTITLFAILGRSDISLPNFNNKQEEFSELLVTVLQEQEYEWDNPIIAAVVQVDNKYVLTKYEIQVNENFQFRALEAVSLNTQPTKLVKGNEYTGILVSLNDKWAWFDDDLNHVDKDLNYKGEDIEDSGLAFVVEENPERNVRILNGIHAGASIKLNSDKQLTQVHPLDKSGRLWLFVFENEMGIGNLN